MAIELDEKFARWKGVDRTKIEWHPKIDKNKCIGCGMYVTSCGRKVFDYNYDEKKAEVSRPYQCMVGCKSCESWCIYDAISFPDTKIVKDFIKNNNLILTSKKELVKCSCSG